VSGYAGFTPVQSAVYAVLTGDVTLAGMITGVFDGQAPEGTAYPYVSYGPAIETPDSAFGVHGRATLVTLDVWSEYRGMAEANAIMSRIHELLAEQPLMVPGFVHVATRFEFGQTLVDPDRPGLRHGVLRFRVYTSKE